MKIVRLNEPVMVDGETLTEISLRRPKVRDRLAVERLGNSDADREVALIANLAELPPATIEELDLADYARVQGALQDFLLP
nr:hypothetical protein 8 [Coxiellaceae bacterium]